MQTTDRYFGIIKLTGDKRNYVESLTLQNADGVRTPIKEERNKKKEYSISYNGAYFCEIPPFIGNILTYN